MVVAMEMALVYLHQPRSPPTLDTTTLRSWKIENQMFACKFAYIFGRGWVHVGTLFISTKESKIHIITKVKHFPPHNSSAKKKPFQRRSLSLYVCTQLHFILTFSNVVMTNLLESQFLSTCWFIVLKQVTLLPCGESYGYINQLPN